MKDSRQLVHALEEYINFLDEYIGELTGTIIPHSYQRASSKTIQKGVLLRQNIITAKQEMLKSSKANP